MTISPTTPPAQTQQKLSCCARIKRALGRLWEWIVDCWHWLVHKIFRVVDAFSFGFFRVVEFFSPRLAMRLEAAYGYLATWYARHTASVRQGALHTQIKDLEALNRGLNQRIQAVAAELGRSNTASHHVLAERDRFKSERDFDIRAREAALEQTRHVEKDCLSMGARIALLNRENARLQKDFEALMSEKSAALSEKERLSGALSSLTHENTLLREQEQLSVQKIGALEQSLHIIGKLNARIGGFAS